MEFSKEEILLMRTVGEVLRLSRQKSGYTSLETFAYDIGMDPAQYGRCERGENMKIISIFRLLSNHNLRLDSFFAAVYRKLKKLNK
ncbi:MAG: helix-turn-helix domain-containing protein [Bacteroidetes bacterium]|nr:helix-turn-helix domain-containing protein [Bacteroidota bacterium]